MLGELVFVGGQLAEWLVTDPAAVRVRPTDDVDVIVAVTSRTAYHRIQEQLRMLGFGPDSRPGAPVCRMRTRDDLVLDVMPLDERVLGFTNRWYPFVVDSATLLGLEQDLVIRAVTAPAFLATKWEAFAGRGGGDILSSHDVEDIITVIAGRPTIVDEVRGVPAIVRTFLAERTREFLAEPWAEEIIESSIPDVRRVPGLLDNVLARFLALGEI